MPGIERSCSVVIPTYGRAVELERCLDAVAAQDQPALEVIIVDNASGDPRIREIARAHAAIYVEEPRRGLCRARNTGARAARAEIVAYLDADSLPEPEWLGAIAREFVDDRVMAAAGRTIPITLETEAEMLFASLRNRAYERDARIVLDRTAPHWFEICGFGGIGAGCNMAVRRSAFDVWPGFNERTDRGTPVHGGGEHFAFFSLVDRGYKVAYTPDAVVRHPYPRTIEELRRDYLRELSASTAYFTLMLVEAPRHRGATLRYILEAIRGRRRDWRPGGEYSRPHIVGPERRFLALLMGPLRYLESRITA